MTKSVDESAAPGNGLGEKSEVIELTDEVESNRGASSLEPPVEPRPDAHQDGDDEVMEDEFDALTREMPEFRVPDTIGDADGGVASGDAPGAAIISGRRRTNVAKAGDDSAESAAVSGDSEPQGDAPASTGLEEAQFDASQLDASQFDASQLDDSQLDASQEDDSREGGSASDGRERVFGGETLQLTAVSRDEMERHYFSERLREAVVLDDHRFAPDVLIAPPRLLTFEWQDGGPLRRARLAAPHHDAGLDATSEPLDLAADAVVPLDAPHDSEAQAPFDGTATIREITSLDDLDENREIHDFDEDDLPELDPDSIEMELEEPSDVDPLDPTPPPQPAGARSGPPPKLPSTSAPLADSGEPAPETELGGLLQEILEDTSDAGQASTSGSHPAQSRQKRARNRPRSPRDTWFQKVFTDEYFRTLPSDIHRQTRREADFIEASLNLQEGDRLLDLACGFGRHSIELSRRGHEVVGLDLSMHMLQKALNEGQRQGLSIKFIHGDMRDLQFEGIFSDCLLWQTSFGFFDDQTNFRVLRGIHRALRPGGELLIEVVNRDHIASRMPHRLWWEGVNCVFLEEVDLDHRTSVLHTKRSFIYEDGTPPLEQSFYIRLYSPHELRHLLHAAGFTVLELSGELHHRGQFLGAASTRVVMRAKKRGPQQGAPQQ